MPLEAIDRQFSTWLIHNKRPKRATVAHLSTMNVSKRIWKSKMSQPIRGQGGHFVFLIGPKNTNLVEDVEILLPVKFRLIPFSGFRGEVEKCLSESEARAAILFFRSARKTQTW